MIKKLDIPKGRRGTGVTHAGLHWIANLGRAARIVRTWIIRQMGAMDNGKCVL
jgi:hypothetical protein